jgi:AcrR family transcriptional regulator
MSLRKRKRDATRKALVDASRRLFKEKGYEGTTLEEICGEANIHVTTFFNYFASKEELAFADNIQYFEAFLEGLRDPERTQDALSYWWEFLKGFDERGREEVRSIFRAFESIPVLKARFGTIIGQYERALAEAFAEESGTSFEEDLYSQTKAAVLLAAHATAGRWENANTGSAERLSVSRLIMSRFPTRAEFEQALAPAASKRRRRPQATD